MAKRERDDVRRARSIDQWSSPRLRIVQEYQVKKTASTITTYMIAPPPKSSSSGGTSCCNEATNEPAAPTSETRKAGTASRLREMRSHDYLARPHITD